MIKISKPAAYLIGLLLTLIIYFIGQLFFFINTEKTTGNICEIKMSGRSLRYSGSTEIFYVCYITKDSLQVKAKGGSNFEFAFGEQAEFYYKKNNPSQIRFNDFSALWLVPAWPYFILWGILMAFYGSVLQNAVCCHFAKAKLSYKTVEYLIHCLLRIGSCF
jgi:hypothetical protein